MISYMIFRVCIPTSENALRIVLSFGQSAPAHPRKFPAPVVGGVRMCGCRVAAVAHSSATRTGGVGVGVGGKERGRLS